LPITGPPASTPVLLSSFDSRCRIDPGNGAVCPFRPERVRVPHLRPVRIGELVGVDVHEVEKPFRPWDRQKDAQAAFRSLLTM
jgi:hypothetical protein